MPKGRKVPFCWRSMGNSQNWLNPLSYQQCLWTVWKAIKLRYWKTSFQKCVNIIQVVENRWVVREFFECILRDILPIISNAVTRSVLIVRFEWCSIYEQSACFIYHDLIFVNYDRIFHPFWDYLLFKTTVKSYDTCLPSKIYKMFLIYSSQKYIVYVYC